MSFYFKHSMCNHATVQAALGFESTLPVSRCAAGLRLRRGSPGGQSRQYIDLSLCGLLFQPHRVDSVWRGCQLLGPNSTFKLKQLSHLSFLVMCCDWWSVWLQGSAPCSTTTFEHSLEIYYSIALALRIKDRGWGLNMIKSLINEWTLRDFKGTESTTQTLRLEIPLFFCSWESR